eukprot:scaffold184_cov316-Pinguiococcus_pyrenoidosus.AAC.51
MSQGAPRRGPIPSGNLKTNPPLQACLLRIPRSMQHLRSIQSARGVPKKQKIIIERSANQRLSTNNLHDVGDTIGRVQCTGKIPLKCTHQSPRTSALPVRRCAFSPSSLAHIGNAMRGAANAAGSTATLAE